MKNNYFVVNHSIDPYYNLALEEFLLTNYLEGVIVMLWQNDNTIVVGRHQNAIEEINQEYVSEQGIKVVRRTTGGGAVYHDLGNLNYSIIADVCGGRDHGMKRHVTPIIKTLQSLGADAAFGGRNDIMIGEKKVSGTAQRVYQNRILHHGCLLFESDLSAVAKSLNVRSEKFQSKSVKSVRSRVGNVKEYLENPVTLEEFKELLTHQIVKDGEYKKLELNTEEKEAVEKLRQEKYETWEWTYGTPVKCAVHNYKRYAGGTVEVYMNIKNGRIEECQMYGDFMALRPASEVAERLIGCRYWYEDILQVLQGFRIWEYFGEISAEEVADSICCRGGLE